MNNTAAGLGGSVRRVLIAQLVLTAAVMAGCFAWYGWSGGFDAALGASFGGGVALAGTWFLARRVRRMGNSTDENASGQLGMYAGAVSRFIATLALLAVGIGWMKLAPVPLIVAFGLAQFGFLANLSAAPRTRG